MPVDSKLSLINECLVLTNEHTVAVADNGSREWINGSAGYEYGLQRLLDEHDWKFAKFLEDVDERDDSPDPNYADMYARPNGCIHVIRVLVDGTALTDWRIVGDQIHVNAEDGITVEGIRDVEPNQFPGLFATALKHFVMAGIYRGLKQQPADARAEDKAGEAHLARARPRGDLEEPGKARFISTMAAARQARRG